MRCNVGSRIFIGDVGLGYKTLNSSLWGEPLGWEIPLMGLQVGMQTKQNESQGVWIMFKIVILIFWKMTKSTQQFGLSIFINCNRLH